MSSSLQARGAATATAPASADLSIGADLLRRELHGWAALSVAALAIAGLLVLLIVPARTPVLQDMLPWDPNVFFRQALVTHVVFSVVIWFLGALGVLTVLATDRMSGRMNQRLRAAWLGPAGLGLTVFAMLMLLAGTLAGLGNPSLNNYVPVLVHPLYYAGLAVLFAGVALPVVRLLLNIAGREVPEPMPWGVASVGLTYLAAPVCFIAAWVQLPASLPAEIYNEQLFWGGGHVLQVVNTGLLIVAWHMVTRAAWGEPLLPRRLFSLVTIALPATAAAGVVYTVSRDVMSSDHYQAFTDLYLYALVVPAVVAMAGLAQVLWRCRARLDWRQPAALGLLLSLVLFGIGGLLGYGLGHGDTRTPAHYHAVIGGVNLALMTLFAAVVLPVLGRAFTRARAVLWFLALYFAGQTIHSVGLYIAGTFGVARKTAGAEQGLDSAMKMAAMGVMGLGGLVAVIGGVLFVWMALRRLWPATR